MFICAGVRVSRTPVPDNVIISLLNFFVSFSHSSPGGLHFVTCKGVSTYLLSLYGIIDPSLPNSTQPYEIVDDINSLTPNTVISQIPDPATKDAHIEKNLPLHTSFSFIDSISRNHETQLTQVMETTKGVPKDGVGEIFYCSKCKATFGRKDELLQHQSSHKKNRPKHGKRITDGVIIRDGKYECQFCHKTFDERRRYNGHVGAHVRYHGKSAEASDDGNVGASIDPCSMEQSVGPSSFGEWSFKKATVQRRVNRGKGENTCSLNDKNIESNGELKGANGGMRRSVAADVVSITEQSAVSKLLSNGNKSFHEGENTEDCADEFIDDDSIFQGGISPLLVDATAARDPKHVDLVENSSGIQNPEKCMVSKTSLLDSSQRREACKVVANNCTSEPRYEIKFDSSKLSMNGPVLNFFGTQSNTRVASESNVSKLDVAPNARMPRDQDANACDKDNVSDLISKCEVDETRVFGVAEKGSYEAANDGVRRHEEMQFDISSATPSWNDQEKVPKENDAATTCLLKEPVMQNNWKSRLAALFGHENMSDLEDNDEEVCGGKNTVSDFDHYQTSGNGESSGPFSSNHAELNSNPLMGSLQDMQLGVCTGLPSATDKRIFQEDGMMRMFDGGPAVQNQGHPRDVSLKPNTILNSGKHELSLSSGNHDTELCTDSSRAAEQRMYQTDRANIQSVDGFNVQSVFHKTFGNQTNLTARNNNVPDDLNQRRPFNIDVADSSAYSIRTHNFGSNFNPAHPDGQMGDSGHNFMASLGNSSSQTVGCGAVDESWRTGHGNVFQGTFDANARLPLPSSNYFGTFGLTSKGGEAQYGVSKSYNMLTPAGRTEPVEYRFLGEQSSSKMPEPEVPKMFAYNANMQQGLDPPFWLRNDARMPYTAHNPPTQVSSICVWCRNMFYHQPDAFGAQTGTIGSICSTCSARIPGQFNGP